MTDWLNTFADSYKWGFLLHQLETILAVYLLGFTVFYALILPGKKSDNGNCDEFGYIKRLAVTVAFPLGTAVFVALGYMMLAFSIPYNSFSVLLACGFIFILSAAKVISEYFKKNVRFSALEFAVAATLVVIVACISVSGLIRISVSNDSLYYFWQYPRAIVHFGGLRDQFDNFLTDTGLGAAVIGTMPFLFGFGETFGIQEFFHISFIGFIGCYIYDAFSGKTGMENKKAYVISALTMLLMATATPIFILAHWAMANMYFMEYFVIALCLSRYMVMNKSAQELKSGFYLVFAVVIFACAQLRMEGGIFILFMILMISLSKADKTKLASTMIPIVLLQSIYECRLFLFYVIDSPYTFMTPLKAVIQFLAYIVMIAYLMGADVFIYRIVPRKYMSIVVMLALVVVNLLLFVLEPSHYIANLRAFVLNLFGQSGWGAFPHMAIGAVVILIVALPASKRQEKAGGLIDLFDIEENDSLFWIYTVVGFFLVVLAVSFARGDDLNVNTGDSGNRVLLQIAPLVIIAIVTCFVNLFGSDKNE